MKANLAQREPMVLKRWEKSGLYQMLQDAAGDKPLFVLHDGPPYANGNIHLGTAFNKILKDIILRSKRAAGFNAPYIPGWDCHGLPIEHNVDKELGEKKKTIPILAKRAACRKYAGKWINTQKKQFKRLGVLGDWDKPYLTINYEYEAVIAREFNRFLLSGAIVRNRKPVHWCSTCTTALAEAEVEYYDHQSPSIYVKFEAKGDYGDIDPKLKGERLFFLIWTTTPWTLPANQAVAVHPEFQYSAIRTGDEIWIVAKELVENLFATLGLPYEEIAVFAGATLENRLTTHPFIDRDAVVVLADYVTTDAGTGCVHTAPGHGVDDYQTGLRYGLEIVSPVDAKGRYTEEAHNYAGRQIPEVNHDLIADMKASGSLVFQADINHSYPHCWRCKEPVMYRATPQWFVSMENNDLRTKALAEIEKVSWTPAWGMQRIFSMVENRPDWCLSRQRSWGVPLTVLSCEHCEEIVKDEKVVAKIDELFRKEGADAWFNHEAADFLPPGTNCSKCGSTSFVKEQDILDVWFDSGVSHAAVCEIREELASPADLYLEGSDQHRGWFQSSLLASTGTRGRAPYKGVLTHGYVVDGQGKKMSKSVGNVVVPSEVIEKYGAEILRLWVASEDYQDDIKVSDEILRQVSDSYRKIRNTIRFFLGNLSDFDVEQDRVEISKMAEIDRWALAKFDQLREEVTQAYSRYEFHSIYQRLNYFCGTTMSSLYLDVLKDRLYASGTDSLQRRAAQTVLFAIGDGLLRLMSPILSFTAEEAYDKLHGRKEGDALLESVFFKEFPQKIKHQCDEEMLRKWDLLLKIRSEITKSLEVARREKVIGHPLEAEVLLGAEDELAGFLEREWQTIKEISIVSELSPLSDEEAQGLQSVSEELGIRVRVRPASGEKCERCWIRSTSVGENQDHPTICRRCVDVVQAMGL